MRQVLRMRNLDFSSGQMCDGMSRAPIYLWGCGRALTEA